VATNITSRCLPAISAALANSGYAKIEPLSGNLLRNPNDDGTFAGVSSISERYAPRRQWSSRLVSTLFSASICATAVFVPSITTIEVARDTRIGFVSPSTGSRPYDFALV
jgi:hypothetical protein